MADKTTKVLEVIVDNNKAVASIAEYNQLIEAQKQKQKELADQYKTGSLSQVDYQRAMAKSKEEIKAYSRSVQELSKEIQNNIKDSQEQEGSLRGLRAQLSNLTKEFDSLSRAERQGDVGRAKMEEINRITTELKAAEEETQRFYRNVGNYPDVKPLETQLGEIKKQLAQLKYEGKDNTEEFAALAAEASNMKDALADVEQQINATASDTKGLDTAVMGLTTVMGGLTLLGPMFADGSEEAEKFNKILQKMQAVMMILNTLRTIQNNTQKQGLLYQAGEKVQLAATTALKKLDAKVTTQQTGATIAQTAAQKVLNAVMKANPIGLLVAGVAALTAGAVALTKAIGGSNEEFERQQQLIEASQAALESHARAYEANISLMEKVGASSEKVMLARIKGLIQLRDEAIAIGDLIRAQEESAWFYDLDRVTEAYDVAKGYGEELMSVVTSAVVQVRAWADENAKFYAQLGMSDFEKDVDNINRKFADQKELIVALRAANQITVEEAGQALVALDRAREQAQAQAAKESADALEAKLEKERQARAKRLQEAIRKETELLRKATDERIALIEDENEREIAAENERHARAIEDLKKRLETEEGLTAKSREALNKLIELEEQKHQQKMADLDKEAREEKRKADEEELKKKIEATNAERKAMEEAVRLEWENRINEAAVQGKNTLQIELDAAKARLDALHQLEGESEAEFRARQLAARKDYVDAEKALNEYEVQMEQAKYDAISSMVGGLTAVLNAFGEDNEQLAKAAKILALAEIAINTGKAIAAGVAAASAAGPFPANLAAIASTVTTVLTNIATAVSTVKSAKFATGGIVSGAGTATSDSIPAMLSNGESVMNARSTSMFSPLLSVMNQAGGGVAFNPAAGSREGFDFLAAAVESGMKHADIHVAVDEISRVNRRVTAIKERSKV